MNKICIGDNFQIQCYKHNGKIERSSDEAIVLEVGKDYIVLGNKGTLIKKADGSFWKTREPAVLYFFKNKWFNIIAQLKKSGITYYCNIATPYIIEDNTIKYIDYDLDLRIYSNGSYKILDKREYNYHKRIMKYSDQLNIAIKNGMDELIKFYESNSRVFDSSENIKYYNEYLEIKNQS